MGYFSIALSGLQADSIALNTIGNDLANLDTTAYKGQTTSFEDLFYRQVGESGSGDPIQVGMGTKVSSTTTDFSQGTILPNDTVAATDMALEGNGFFLVEQNDEQVLTRAGDFEVTSNGNLVTQDGATVLGYPVINEPAKETHNFSVEANFSPTAAVGDTVSTSLPVFDGLGDSHVMTVRFTNAGVNTWNYSLSLPAAEEWTAPVVGTLTFSSAGVPSLSWTNMAPILKNGAPRMVMNWNPTGLTNTTAAASQIISSEQDGMARITQSVNVNANPQTLILPVGSTQEAQATRSISATVNLNSNASVGTSFTTPIHVYDSLGQPHSAMITYDKNAANIWNYSISLQAGDATGMPTGNTGILTFDSKGNLTSPLGVVNGITFPGLVDGANDLSFNWNLNGNGSEPTITQLESANANDSVEQDGFGSGNYSGFAVDSSGVIQAKFSNGNTEIIGQLAVATVSNDQGLVAIGNNTFRTTAASGLAVAGEAGTGGRGTVDDRALEQSNVDISTEFTNLILAQRAFDANSKTITTFDTVSQDAIAMVR